MMYRICMGKGGNSIFLISEISIHAMVNDNKSWGRIVHKTTCFRKILFSIIHHRANPPRRRIMEKYLLNFVPQDENPFKQGAEAKLYKITYEGKDAVLKERFSKKYRHPILDKRITKERTKAEVKGLIRCKNIGVKVPEIYAYDYKNGLLIMEHLADSISASEFISKRTNCRELNHFVSAVGDALTKMYTADIVHGDLTPANMLVKCLENELSELYVIDFGLSHGGASVEDKGVDLYVLERALISAHSQISGLFQAILSLCKPENADKIMKKFEEVRRRGRKRCMLG